MGYTATIEESPTPTRSASGSNHYVTDVTAARHRPAAFARDGIAPLRATAGHRGALWQPRARFGADRGPPRRARRGVGLHQGLHRRDRYGRVPAPLRRATYQRGNPRRTGRPGPACGRHLYRGVEHRLGGPRPPLDRRAGFDGRVIHQHRGVTACPDYSWVPWEWTGVGRFSAGWASDRTSGRPSRTASGGAGPRCVLTGAPPVDAGARLWTTPATGVGRPRTVA